MIDFEWHWLSTRDQASNNWILYDEKPPVELRLRYHQFRCSKCGKVDEDAALESGLDNITLKSRCDIFRSSEGIYCFSDRARQVFESNNLQGLKFLSLPFPNKRNHEIALPTISCPVNREKSGFQWTDYPTQAQPKIDDENVFCSLCHRPKAGAYVGPFLDSMIIPEDPLCVLAPSISPENSRGKIYWILVSDLVKDIFKQSRLIGVEFNKPF